MVICKPSIGVTLLLPLVSLNKPTIDGFLVYNSFCIKTYIQQRTLLIKMWVIGQKVCVTNPNKLENL